MKFKKQTKGKTIQQKKPCFLLNSYITFAHLNTHCAVKFLLFDGYFSRDKHDEEWRNGAVVLAFSEEEYKILGRMTHG